MKFLHLSCSPRGGEAESYRLSEVVMGHLLVRHPDASIMRRQLVPAGIAHVDDDSLSCIP